MRGAQFASAFINGLLTGAVGLALGFYITGWQWWLVAAGLMVAYINGRVTA